MNNLNTNYLDPSVRWTDKLTLCANGDIIEDFTGKIVGHITPKNFKVTNEEAQTILRKFYSLDDTENEALNLAIKGLEFINENFPESFKDYLNGEQYRE